MSSDFLVEIGCEELPPKSLLSLSEAFRDNIALSFAGMGLTFGDVKAFASPRRLAVRILSLDESLPDKEIVNWGPPVKVAFDSEGLLTKAGAAFAAKNNLDADADRLRADFVENDGSQDKLCFRATLKGGNTTDVLQAVVEGALAQLPIPKRMRWGAGKAEFVRPVHWVVLLFGADSPAIDIYGVRSSNISRGHRFLSQGDVVVASPELYEENLLSAHVIADFAVRRSNIEQQVREAANKSGGTAVIDPDLLDEVTALNEWPVALVGSFEDRFLDVPPEALISSMREHQKYFHMEDDSGHLLPRFITISNIESKEPAKVVAGNEKVIRPRLSDAAFFYETDKKTSQTERRERLKSIVFQDKLGSIFDKTARIAKLAEILASYVGADPVLAKRAGELCKSDLVSDMVLEFDDLQGLMGRYYAINDGEPSAVAEALFEHYLPRFAGDTLPGSAEGIAVALADRIDSLVGIFGIGQVPSGSKDPFALRRASLGVIRLIVEKRLDIDLADALDKAFGIYGSALEDASAPKRVLTYIMERFNGLYPDVAPQTIQAVMACANAKPLDIDSRIRAVESFRANPAAESLAAANKRVANILAKQPEDLLQTLNSVDVARLQENAEIALAKALSAKSAEIEPLIAKRAYGDTLTALAALEQPVDNFFNEVMVMVDDEAIRNNRLAMLSALRELFLQVADISLMAALAGK